MAGNFANLMCRRGSPAGIGSFCAARVPGVAVDGQASEDPYSCGHDCGLLPGGWSVGGPSLFRHEYFASSPVWVGPFRMAVDQYTFGGLRAVGHQPAMDQ